MTISNIGESQGNATRVAGFAFLLAMAIVVLANYGISFRLSVPGNPAETARNIMANQGLFRINIACNLLYGATIEVLLSALYVILEPVDREPCLGCGILQTGSCIDVGCYRAQHAWRSAALGWWHLLERLRSRSTAGTGELLHLDAGYDAHYDGLPFWGLASTVCSYLWLKSGYVPRALATFGVLSSAWCVFCAFAFLMSPDFQNTVHPMWFDMPMVVFEMALGLWLLLKGLSASGTAEPDRARAEQPETWVTELTRDMGNTQLSVHHRAALIDPPE